MLGTNVHIRLLGMWFTAATPSTPQRYTVHANMPARCKHWLAAYNTANLAHMPLFVLVHWRLGSVCMCVIPTLAVECVQLLQCVGDPAAGDLSNCCQARRCG